MSDDQNFDDNMGEETQDISGEGSSGKKGLKPLLMKILYGVIAAIVGTVFVVTVVILTLNFMDRGNQAVSFADVSQEYSKDIPVYEYYPLEGDIEIRGRTKDKVPRNFVIKLLIGYPQADESTKSELIQRLPKIQDQSRQYFNNLTYEFMKNPDNENRIKEELRERINQFLSSRNVKDIIFTQFSIYDF